MANDFTRINFGWWEYTVDKQPDIFEYGTSRAAAWDCPMTMWTSQYAFEANPRTADNLEVIRRWEDVRAKKWLTPEQKEELKNTSQEHILIINENEEYELIPYECISASADCSDEVSAFIFERKAKNCVVCWHKTGKGKLRLLLPTSNVCYFDDITREEIPFESNGKYIDIPIEGRRYLVTDLDKNTIIKAFNNAELLK